MVVGICKIDFLIDGNRSLKGKRRVIKTLIERVKNRFNVSISEVDNNDLWQRGSIGFSVVSNNKNYINSTLDKTLNFIENLHLVEIIDHSFEFIHLNE